MKTTINIFLVMLIASVLLYAGCREQEVITNKCEETVLSNSETKNIYLKLKLNNTQLVNNQTYLYDSDSLSINGSAILITCEGGHGNTYSFVQDNNLSSYTADSISKGFYLEEFHEFTFNNSSDYILTTIKMYASFANGKTFESEDITFRITYTELKYDPITTITYAELVMPLSTHWYQRSK
ncbi:MAG: hypothetical protein IPH84_15370 [Bacteroidales bacterium]|nr:hypothetical protein [Bacteroidales bacterium]